MITKKEEIAIRKAICDVQDLIDIKLWKAINQVSHEFTREWLIESFTDNRKDISKMFQQIFDTLNDEEGDK